MYANASNDYSVKGGSKKKGNTKSKPKSKPKSSKKY